MLKLLIDHVELRHDTHTINARIIWKTGFIQTIAIERAMATSNRYNRWTEKENNLLKALWSESTKEVLQKALPNRNGHSITNHANRLGITIKDKAALRRVYKP
jgi:hypothetical protein